MKDLVETNHMPKILNHSLSKSKSKSNSISKINNNNKIQKNVFKVINNLENQQNNISVSTINMDQSKIYNQNNNTNNITQENSYRSIQSNNNNIKTNNYNTSQTNQQQQQLQQNSTLNYTQQYQEMYEMLNSLQLKINRPIQKSLCLSNFEFLKQLGKGRFGKVFQVKDKITGFRMAMKVIDKCQIKSSKIEKQLLQEIKIQSYINHPNVLKMYSYFDDPECIYLLLELAPEGDLYQKLHKNKMFQEEIASVYIRQVCEALIHLHQEGVIHRDLKPENILMINDVTKISDFGWSIYTQELRNTFCGTLDYVSPEIIQGQQYDNYIDIWSVGILTYELLTGKPPFNTKTGNQQQAFTNIIYNDIEYPDTMSEQAIDFIQQFLHKNPKQRKSLQEGLEHPWIQQNSVKAFKSWKQDISHQMIDLINSQD